MTTSNPHTKFAHARFSFFLISIAVASAVFPARRAMAGTADAPAVFGYDTAKLASVRQRVAARDPDVMPAYNDFLSVANRTFVMLAMQPKSVMDKTKVAASGDKHDYFSPAPYYWPDPTKPGGVPYIRRDGKINLKSRQGTDADSFPSMCDAVETLGLAYYFSGNEVCAKKAAQLATVWFLDPATRMNPNFAYAQAIPGEYSGRSSGVLQARHLTNLCDGLAFIATSPAWPPKAQAAMRAWLEAYYTWVTTSRSGKREAAALNNHGTWCNAQIAHIELVLGKTGAARERIEKELKARIGYQILPDGGQPRELVRTRSFGYSLFNLEALFALAQLGDHVGFSEGWTYTTKDGRSLRAALAYVARYLDPAQEWPHQEIGAMELDRASRLVGIYLAHHNDPEIRALWYKYSPVVSQRDGYFRSLLF